MVKSPLIFQVVGYQDSGKTTIVNKIIQALADEWRVVTIKHHGHGQAPELPSAEKDTSKHLQSGAFASVVEGGGHLLLQTNPSDWKLDKQIQLVKTLQPDLLLIEGHKKANYHKVVIVRRKEDLQLLDELLNVQFVVYWDEVEERDFKNMSQNLVKLNNDSEGVSFIINEIEKQLKK